MGAVIVWLFPGLILTYAVFQQGNDKDKTVIMIMMALLTFTVTYLNKSGNTKNISTSHLNHSSS